MPHPPPSDEPYLEAALHCATVCRTFLAWMEEAAERLAPERLAGLSRRTADHREPLARCRSALDAATVPAEMAAFDERLRAALEHATRACDRFAGSAEAPFAARIPALLESMHELARAHECLYGLRHALAPLAGFWDLSGSHPGEPEAGSADTGIIHVSRGGHHGGFSLYVPERYTPDRSWPVIMALHGGSGSGRDFLWTWLREARTEGYILLAPSSIGSTWGIEEDRGLLEILAWLEQRYRIDRDRILLTGLSDGASFTLLYGLAHPRVYRALAPVSGVLHPANEQVGNLKRAHDFPIYLVHGALDFLFPIALARRTRDTLQDAGARLTYRELPELSHTYPRSENIRILRWFATL